jgi:hypothetical protein
MKIRIKKREDKTPKKIIWKNNQILPSTKQQVK